MGNLLCSPPEMHLTVGPQTIGNFGQSEMIHPVVDHARTRLLALA
jgi:hypothetical protein